MTKSEAREKQQKMLKTIRFIAKKKGMKLKDLESAIGVSIGYISRCEGNSKKNISVIVVMLAADHLGFSVNDLLDPDFIKKRELEELAIEMDELDQKRAALEMRRKEIEDDAT